MVSISRSSFYYEPVGETEETLAPICLIDAQFLLFHEAYQGVAKGRLPFGGSGQSPACHSLSESDFCCSAIALAIASGCDGS